MRKKIFVVLLLVVVLITGVGCNHESNPKAYQLDYYMDTIRGHVIIFVLYMFFHPLSLPRRNR